MIHEIELEFDAPTMAILIREGCRANYMHDRTHVEWRLNHILSQFAGIPEKRDELAENLRYYGFISDLQAIKMEKGLDWKWKN